MNRHRRSDRPGFVPELRELGEYEEAVVRQVRDLIQAYVRLSPDEFTHYFADSISALLTRKIIGRVIEREGNNLKRDFKRGKNLEDFLKLIPEE